MVTPMETEKEFNFSGWILFNPGTQIRIFSSAYIDSIEVDGMKHGGSGGKPGPMYTLSPDEKMVAVSGRNDSSVLYGLQFHTNRTITVFQGSFGGKDFYINNNEDTIRIGIYHDGTLVEKVCVR